MNIDKIEEIDGASNNGKENKSKKRANSAARLI